MPAETSLAIYLPEFREEEVTPLDYSLAMDSLCSLVHPDHLHPTLKSGGTTAEKTKEKVRHSPYFPVSHQCLALSKEGQPTSEKKDGLAVVRLVKS